MCITRLALRSIPLVCAVAVLVFIIKSGRDNDYAFELRIPTLVAASADVARSLAFSGRPLTQLY